MKKVLIWLLVLIGVMVPGCRIKRIFSTRELVPQNVLSNKSDAYFWTEGDLDNSNRDHLLLATKFGDVEALLMLDQAGKELSQLNFTHKIRYAGVLSESNDENAWLFASLNDQKEVLVMAWQYQWGEKLVREEKTFEPIARTDSWINDPKYDWTAVLVPNLLEDIDNDGKLELVCLAFDGFTVNPRGLVVYDFETGDLKWRLDLSTCVVSVICADFDGNGAKELICGTQAFKNTNQEMMGMNDMSSWVFVVSARGELLYSEKACEGYSQVLLASDDVNKDGNPEILMLVANKGNAPTPDKATWMKWTGHRFVPITSWTSDASFNLTGNAPILNRMEGEQNDLILVTALNSPLIALDMDLKPVQHILKDQIKYVWAVEDLDLDGKKEIFVQTEDNNFMVLNSDLKAAARLQNPWPPEKPVKVHIVKSGLDKAPRVALSSGAEMRFYSYQRLAFWGLLWNFIRANVVNLHILIFLIVVSLIVYIVARSRLLRTTMNSLDQGVIMVDWDDNLIRINRYLLEMIGYEKDHSRIKTPKTLYELYPQISTLLPDFYRSKELKLNTVLSLGPSELRHAAQFRRLRGIISGCIITLSPEGLARETQPGCIDCSQSSKSFYLNARRHISRANQALKPLQEALGDPNNPDLKTVHDEIDKIQRLASAFQRFHESMDYQLRPLNLLPSVELCLERLKIPANVELTKDWEKGKILAWIEPARFEEALSSLLANALEAMPDGGSLHLSLKEMDAEEKRVELTVRDSGNGIAEKQMDDVWKPFYTTKEENVGMGLTESRKIVEAMGGSLDLQSEEGRGTSAIMVLKGAKQPAPDLS